MKNNIKFFVNAAALACVLFLTGVLSLNAQTSHHISVMNNYFSPATITIDIGDTIIWTNNSGNHNVNGSTTTYPNNPTSFGNGVGTGWTYSHVFTEAGTYDYVCDPHVNFGMKGKVIVQGLVSIESNILEKPNILLFPQPFSDKLNIAFKNMNALNHENVYLVVFDILGNEIFRGNIYQNQERAINTTQWKSSVYFYQIRNDRNILETGRIVKQ